MVIGEFDPPFPAKKVSTHFGSQSLVPHLQLGVMDMIHFLSKVQDAAQDSATQLSSVHRASLHAVIAGILYMLSKISHTPALSEHVEEMIELRRETAPVLLPDGVFSQDGRERGAEITDGAGGITYPSKVGEELLFQLRERGLDRQSPEPAVDTRRGEERVERNLPTSFNVLFFCTRVSSTGELRFFQ